jgi:dTMP kinase
MKRARYICLEGTEGVGKTTQTQKLVDTLRSQGYKVLQTKEPGTTLAPLTMTLRGIMLDAQYDAELTKPAREYLSQAIRSIHLEKVIVPALSEYDFIIQDRGILSGYAYGQSCGNDISFLRYIATSVVDAANEHDLASFDPVTERIYDKVVYLRGDSKKGLARATSSKKEFAAGDAIEAKGNAFMQQTSANMDEHSRLFNTCTIEVDGKTIDEVHQYILQALELKDS